MQKVLTTLVALAVVSTATPVLARDYRLVSVNDQNMMVVDASTSKRDAQGNLQMWVTMFYKTPTERMSVSKSLVSFDCNQNRTRNLASAAYDDKYNFLQDLGSSSCDYTIPDTVMDNALSFACGRPVNTSTVPNIVQDEDLLSAFRQAGPN